VLLKANILFAFSNTSKMQKTPQHTKKYHDPETELTCNSAHNVQMDVSVFSVIFNDFCSVL